MQFMQEVDKEKEGELELGMRTALVVGKKESWTTSSVLHS